MKSFYTKAFWAILTFTLVVRVFRLGIPPAYVFDEVYHVVTVRAHAENNPAGYEWWHEPPEKGTAYDWLHPPLAKLIQAGSVKLLGDNSFAWRFPSALFGTLAVAAVFTLAQALFKNPKLSLLAAAFFSLDGLALTMSRITMNDIFVTTFMLLALTFFYRALKGRTLKHLYLTGIFTGLALATKHSALAIYPIFAVFLLPQLKVLITNPKKLLITVYSLLIIPVVIYFLSYLQFFAQGHSLIDFYHLHQQIYWYQTGLSATHDYQTAALTWPLLARPVWFYVDYAKDTIANIYNLGNPAVFWGGLVAVIYALYRHQRSTIYLLVSYFLLWLPWSFSPRILFLHHYLPALSLLTIIIAWALIDFQKTSPQRGRLLIIYYTTIVVALFLFFYPINTAVHLPKNLVKYWFWLPTWK
ncbi:MAG: Dolichyl-phosphate-mannose-protein mannosyltransferase family protein [Candidatus Beckwithbacteria bacterium GW2011_GWB1_47_15]|uniref:Polyprenol-phosphate-mannose--protein mannosyltransferase n=1 Tax=Candidatus Beckwithbacteria bacterium GW2011_GWB1_47_15 TaxID=1618371 RepID=A0A0G1UVV0_9BACT|nr:MAG: dolichyl-phosphate-mannose-protein mannosyltransferase [Candidatus Beckwithbacteria bacterium GW2011_GWC1_49_16]AQS30694.1 hypothetical protein [uncultured bacterium]KKU35881.1 MAG: Dolichyl-phosphate-mannose-protein mannosyltransferase family protein [Candidatus Beckwithbacteria bacterium GW2011_GWA1_46_30]KKU61845.1 MAG: Dolichyl-phosphate-mannose-protein mannosyltransferase family protein [Candidatus Beckwithbacteria bacterium GW2011_GWB1_47_15]KKU72601.1 MAG: Dolichyl-phosphate-mann